MSFKITIEDFLLTLENYNLDIWPLQVFSYILGILAVVLAIKSTKYSNRIISLILSIYWLWIGMVFCLIYWSKTYEPAYIFGVMIIIQGLIFLNSFFRQNISFSFKPDFYSIFGILLIFYSMIGYPFVGLFIGHTYPRFFPFGLVPCPTIIFTFGLLLWADRKFSRYIIINPTLCSLPGFLAVYHGIFEDIGLIISGLLAAFLIFYKYKNKGD